MHRLTLSLLTLIFIATSATAQGNGSSLPLVQEMPELIGGIDALLAEVRYPEIARKANVEGRVIVQFIVDKNGEVREPSILRGIGESCDQEAIRVITEHAKFIPGRHDGRPVSVRMSIPIVFRLR